MKQKLTELIRENSFVVYNLMFDMLTIIYVLAFGLNPVRVIFFYWLDTCLMLFFVMMYLHYTGVISTIIELVAATFVILMINTLFLPFILDIFQWSSLGAKKEPIEIDTLLYPYFDIGIFLVVSFMANLNFHKRIRSLVARSIDVSYAVYMNCIMGMVIVAIVPLLASILRGTTVSISVAIILSFLIIRNCLDYAVIQSLRRAGQAKAT